MCLGECERISMSARFVLHQNGGVIMETPEPGEAEFYFSNAAPAGTHFELVPSDSQLQVGQNAMHKPTGAAFSAQSCAHGSNGAKKQLGQEDGATDLVLQRTVARKRRKFPRIEDEQ